MKQSSDGNKEKRPPASNHYQDNCKIQPMDFIDGIKGLSFSAGNVIKYVARYNFKGSAMKDLEKARYYLERVIADQIEKESQEYVDIDGHV